MHRLGLLAERHVRSVSSQSHSFLRANGTQYDHQFEPPNEYVALKYEYMCLSPAERKSREIRAKWRQYHQEKHGFPSRFVRHHPDRISDDEYARREEVAQAINPVLAQYELRRDMRHNLTALIAELTRVSISEKGKGDIDTGTRASIAVLATRLGLTRRTIQRRLRWLEAHNLVSRIETRPEGKRQRANVYVLSRDMCRHAARVDIITRRRARQTQRAVRMLIRYPLPRPTLSPAEKEAEQTYIKNGFEQLLKEMKAKLKAKAKTTESGKERGCLPHKNLAWNGAERGAGIYDRASSSQHGTRKNVAPSSMLNEFSNRYNDAKAAFGGFGANNDEAMQLRLGQSASHEACDAICYPPHHRNAAHLSKKHPQCNTTSRLAGAANDDFAENTERNTHDPHDNIGIFVEKLIARLSKNGFHVATNGEATTSQERPSLAKWMQKPGLRARLARYVRRWLAAGAKPIDIARAFQSPHASEAQYLAYFTSILHKNPAHRSPSFCRQTGNTL